MGDLKLDPRSHVHAVAKAICRETCAHYGEPACFYHEWPNPDCNEPGCIALAWAALGAFPLQEKHDAT